MAHNSNCLLNYLAILLLLSLLQSSQAHRRTEDGVKTEVFLSPKFVLEPGSVSNKYYYGINFPRGHIAIKSFNAEVVDEEGNAVPLHETYLHHWVLLRYYQQKGVDVRKYHGDLGFHRSDHITIKNSGVCDSGLSQYFGLGSETRRTATDVPDPYGIEVGNPVDIPAGYEEGWVLNVHAIDTRGAEDKLGCTECRCHLYNVTIDEYGRVLPPDYNGGLKCCYDEMRCKVKEGFEGVKRSLYLRYTVKYVDWDSSIVPVKIYILDVTDIWTKADESRGLRERHHCLVEYEVESCPAGSANSGCTHTKALTTSLPTGGDVIYGVGHQHAGGTGTTLYGEGGRVICSSNPTYGKGNEPGNEAGYIVGMSTCYPLPGTVKIYAGEALTLVSNYSSTQGHTGAHTSMMLSNIIWPIVLFGVAIIVVVVIVFKGETGQGEGYEAML
ncbi:hypothetical protein CDL12_26049 [Handroanthus impetiginosus]|uniref:Stress up-regulated Nod 19 n=1 Tax=Handroanthus impetiginosus TaxID=429701 RepID=A0A2G9G816_9LAMI|nr:hypothetical protein CDL12_26049 [Handroanthus impetiginosus]